MSTKETQSLESRIKAHQEDMPPAERRLADLLLGFPGNIATYSATELADMAGTSKAAATRFFRRIGYKDFNEARREARGARMWGSPLYLSTTSRSREVKNQLISNHTVQETQNLDRTLEALRPDTLREVSSALANAQRVFIVGFRNSRMLAFYLQRQLQLLRTDINLFPSAGQTIGEDLVDLGAGDVVVVVGLRRRVNSVLKILETANKQGARSILITDPSASRTTRIATWNINCEVRSASLFDSYTSAYSVLNLVCANVLTQIGNPALDRLRRIEALHDDLEELDQGAWFSGILDEPQS